ncbi:MAG: hypothetical protein QGF59_04500, partial [Pirellulaceae bacterium]|nr:hypothetical protein [Pirellulaceae bacterium]
MARIKIQQTRSLPSSMSPSTGARRTEPPIPDTYEWYRFRLQLFVPHIPADLKTDMPRPFHVR